MSLALIPVQHQTNALFMKYMPRLQLPFVFHWTANCVKSWELKVGVNSGSAFSFLQVYVIICWNQRKSINFVDWVGNSGENKLISLIYVNPAAVKNWYVCHNFLLSNLCEKGLIPEILRNWLHSPIFRKIASPDPQLHLNCHSVVISAGL